MIRGCLQCDAKDHPIPNDVTHSAVFATIAPIVIEYRKMLKELAAIQANSPASLALVAPHDVNHDSNNNHNHVIDTFTNS